LDVHCVVVVVRNNIDIGSIVIQTLESVSVAVFPKNRIDAIRMNKYLDLIWYYHTDVCPNIIDGNGHTIVVVVHHCVDLNQIRIICAHSNVTAILLN